MSDSLLNQRLRSACRRVREELLAVRHAEGYWVGELSSSALSTATAVCALSVSLRNGGRCGAGAMRLIDAGLKWLADHQNRDGGWGDTTASISNISTTALCWAAFGAVSGADHTYSTTVSAAASWIAERAGGIEPEHLSRAIVQRYGKDRTFSVPILTMCALSGRLGPPPACWEWVLPLPFELAACPHPWFAALKLPVVSYALPALIAIGQVRFHCLPPRSLLARWTRSATRARTLNVLQSIQPSSGGFLEATPLTSFVVMSLAGSGNVDHPVARNGIEFLNRSVRADGSWPIDTNLSTWVTTLSINALGSPGESDHMVHSELSPQLSHSEKLKLRDWLIAQQYRVQHPYTHAAPGGWAWTDLPGGVPDADDTAGALLALALLPDPDGQSERAAIAGVEWLIGLQNRDGGIPTFCRGWGALPFDRSSPDLTAHALRAWRAWAHDVSPRLQARIRTATVRAVEYLRQTQRTNGSWIPLWFGNQYASDDENPIYGAARVLFALDEMAGAGLPTDIGAMIASGVQFLLRSQSSDGSWGAYRAGRSSIEETALALEALSCPLCRVAVAPGEVERALSRGALWLIDQVEAGTWTEPAPIGFYFAKLWYYERLYPIIFSAAALTRLLRT